MIHLRLLALDVDGTLLDGAHRVAAPVREAIREVHAGGCCIVLASARHVGSLAQLMGELGVPGWVVAFSGGAAARVDAEGATSVLYQSRLSMALATELASQCLADELAVAWYDLSGWFAPSLDGAHGWYLREASILEQAPVVCPGLRDMAEAPNKLQIVATTDADQARLRALQARLQRDHAGELTAVFSHDDMLEVLPAGTDKAGGLARIAEWTGIALEQALCIGDGENDIDMLRAAGFSIAMGQSPAAVREVAHWVTRSNLDDGVAYALSQPWLRERLIHSNLKAPSHEPSM